MATAYTMTGSGTLRDIGTAAIFGVATARTGGDTFALSGFTLTIDQDTNYGLSGNNAAAGTATSIGNITVSATLGGTLNIDATKVWMIPFTGGSGTLTAGTQITIGGVTCNTIGLYSALNVAPVLTGVAAGWLKVTNVSGTPGTISSGTYAGYTITANGAAVRGFIEVRGDDASTITANRLGTVNILGDWFDVGTTSGSSATTYQLPTNGTLCYMGAVWVETGTGTGVYEAIPCAGSLTAASSTATDIRGKCCWITTGGLLRFGSDGTNTVGYVIPAGRKIRIPNVLLTTCTAAARNAVVIPSSTLATRMDFTTTGGGVVNMSVVSCNWYLSIAQAYSFSASYVATLSSISLTEIAQPMTISHLAVGQEAATSNTAFILGLCYAGGTFSNCVFTRAALATAVYIATVTDCSDFTFSNCRNETRLVKGNVGAGSWYITRAVNCAWSGQQNTGAKAIHVGCDSVTWTNTHYNDKIVGVTATTAGENNSVWELVTAASYRMKFDGLDFNAIVNTAPYISLLSIGVAGCSDIKLRNIGTYAAPLALGTATVFTGAVILGLTGGALNGFKMQRVYVANTRLNGLYYGSATVPDNSSINWTLENCFSDYADAADLGVILNLKRKGIGGVPSVAASASIYGTHFLDCHTSTTAGRIAILMNEPTASTTSQVTLTNGANFTSAGGLYMPVIGMTATFETPEYVIGHTGFSATAGTMAGGTVGNYRFEYSIDKNDGNGYSAMTASAYTAAALATAMNATTGINAANGFKLRLKISTTTTNATAITSFYILTTSTTTSQAYQYPLDTASVSVSGLVTGSRVKATKVSDGTVLFNGAESSGSVSFQTEYIGAVNIEARKASGSPFYIPWVTQVTTISGSTVSATALQQLDE